VTTSDSNQHPCIDSLRAALVQLVHDARKSTYMAVFVQASFRHEASIRMLHCLFPGEVTVRLHDSRPLVYVKGVYLRFLRCQSDLSTLQRAAGDGAIIVFDPALLPDIRPSVIEEFKVMNNLNMGLK